ncbi:MAG TPA: hypothetical protein DCS38_01425 [Ruminococcus sp.]|nr:hypothetical protein [Ruminococcus sp.]HBN10762.1 hypothetical protein [Ruminococcus sp.]HCR73407.1 hypothetical protein [Ruminococcus sp.]
MSFLVGFIVIISIIVIIFMAIKESENTELKAFIVLLLLSGVGLLAGSVFDESKIMVLTKCLFIGSMLALVIAIIRALF